MTLEDKIEPVFERLRALHPFNPNQYNEICSIIDALRAIAKSEDEAKEETPSGTPVSIANMDKMIQGLIQIHNGVMNEITGRIQRNIMHSSISVAVLRNHSDILLTTMVEMERVKHALLTTSPIISEEGYVAVKVSDLLRIRDRQFECSPHQHGMAASALAEEMLSAGVTYKEPMSVEMLDTVDAKDDPAFVDAWRKLEEAGFIYSASNIEKVHLGWQIAEQHFAKITKTITEDPTLSAVRAKLADDVDSSVGIYAAQILAMLPTESAGTPAQVWSPLKITLEITQEELTTLQRMGDDLELSSDAIYRQALRHYQLAHHRIKDGETVTWSGDAQRARDFAGPFASEGIVRMYWKPDEIRDVPASPPSGWLKEVKKLTGINGPDAGVLWATTLHHLPTHQGAPVSTPAPGDYVVVPRKLSQLHAFQAHDVLTKFKPDTILGKPVFDVLDEVWEALISYPTAYTDLKCYREKSDKEI